jgi:hypothetical protein
MASIAMTMFVAWFMSTSLVRGKFLSHISKQGECHSNVAAPIRIQAEAVFGTVQFIRVSICRLLTTGASRG